MARLGGFRASRALRTESGAAKFSEIEVRNVECPLSHPARRLIATESPLAQSVGDVLSCSRSVSDNCLLVELSEALVNERTRLSFVGE